MAGPGGGRSRGEGSGGERRGTKFNRNRGVLNGRGTGGARLAVLGPGGRKASVSGFLLGAAGPRAGGRVGLGCFTGLFYKKRKKKKIKVSGGGRRRGFFVKFFFGFFSKDFLDFFWIF